MLHSPGHSPRHLSTPSASPTPQTLTLTSSTTTPSSSSSSSIQPKRRRPAVLDEDTYVEAIERIIERDFFPDIPRLRDRLDWLEALRSRDPVLIRDAQLKIRDRRRLRSQSTTPFPTPTPTPSSAFPSLTPSGTDTLPAPPDPNPNPSPSPSPDVAVDTSLSLDEFFHLYTSEDNESFSRIIDKVNKRRREKYAHLLARDGEVPTAAALEAPDNQTKRITDGYGSSDQPSSTLVGWKYTARNLLMYDPTDRGEVPLTVEERAQRMKGMTKEIDRASTRFHGRTPADDAASAPQKEEGSSEILYAPVPVATPAGASWPFGDREAEKTRKYDLEDLKKTPNPFYAESGKKAENGYSFVRTPSPAPGVDASPFMTWGEIEGTPLRLDPEDTPVNIVGSSDGPHFSIPRPPSRDVKAHSLSREAARRLRERSKMFQKPPLPSPVRSGSASPSVRMLSPAAQKFVRNAMAKSSRSIDETLRASYRGTSPLSSTPKRPASSTRFGREASLKSRSPSAAERSASPW